MDEKLLKSLRDVINVLFLENIEHRAFQMATTRIFAELAAVSPEEVKAILLKHPALCEENREKLMIAAEDVNPGAAAAIDSAGRDSSPGSLPQ